MEKIKIFSIGFEGPNRAGKGLQIELLEKKLKEINIPYIVIRGAGSRQNEGINPGDPVSEWWTDVIPKLRAKDASLEEWDKSSYRLARELIVFRDRILPKLAVESNSNVAFLLIDRSILSQTMVPRERGDDNIKENLYPENARVHGRKISPEDVCPDVIFNLVADKEMLLSRLDKNDPKFEFRKKLILGKSDWFKDAVEFIPEGLRDSVINIDASSSPEVIHEKILEIINGKVTKIN